MSSTAFLALCCVLIVGYADALCQFESDGTFLPDPSSRQRFIYCMGGQMISGYCAPGEEFDPFDRVCEVPRWNPQPIPTTTLSPRDVCFNRPDGTFLPVESNRQRFIYCWGGQSIEGKCENGLFFDPIDGVCDVLKNNPEAPREPCTGRPDDTILPDPTSNRRFLFCRNGVSIPAFCPEGMLFDPQGLYCDYPQSAPTIPPPSPTRQTTSRPPPPPPTRTTPRAGPPPPPTRTTPRAGPPPPPVRTTTRARQPNPPAQPTRAPIPTRAQPNQPTRPVPNRNPAPTRLIPTRPTPARTG